MPLQKKQLRKLRPIPRSFRFSEIAERHLDVICRALNLKQIEVVEGALKDAYEGAKRKYPSEIKQAENELKNKR